MYCIRKVNDDYTWVGADCRRLALFEGVFGVPDGVSFNSYLLMDDKTVLFDTVDSAVRTTFRENVAHVLNGKAPDYLVVHHMEPDHAAEMADLARQYPDMGILCSAAAKNMIAQFFDAELAGRVTVVKEGDTLCTGRHTLRFIAAPMVHWPEVMVTYEQSEKVLFSADGFGKFGSLSVEEPWEDEARRYFINIVGKYGAPVQALLKKAAALDVAMICPLHGPVLTENLGHYIGLYDTWSSYKPEDKGVLVAYASIHGNTAKAAQKFAEMLRAKGVEKVSVMDLSRDDMAEVVEDAFRYDRMVLAAASYDGGVFPCMQDFLHHLQSKAFQNRTVGIIENGTWGPTAGRTMKGILETMKNITIVEPMVTIRSTMKESDLPAMEALADVIANA